MQQLNVEEIEHVSGGVYKRFIGPLGIFVAAAEGLYDFYQGFSDHRK